MSTGYQPPQLDDAAYAAWYVDQLIAAKRLKLGESVTRASAAAWFVEQLAPYTAAGNRWWLSTHPEVRAYWQLREPTQLYGFHEYASDMAALLGRVVFAHEFIAPRLREKLLAQSQAAYDRWMARPLDGPDQSEQAIRDLLGQSVEAVVEFYKAAAGTGLTVEIVDTGDLGRMGYGQSGEQTGKGDTNGE